MNYNNCSNVVGEVISRVLNGRSHLLDENNIIWKLIDNEWIGKRSVWTFDWKSCWLEETTIDNVKSWWCGGKSADYSEVFQRTDLSIETALKHYVK